MKSIEDNSLQYDDLIDGQCYIGIFSGYLGSIQSRRIIMLKSSSRKCHIIDANNMYNYTRNDYDRQSSIDWYPASEEDSRLLQSIINHIELNEF